MVILKNFFFFFLLFNFISARAQNQFIDSLILREVKVIENLKLKDSSNAVLLAMEFGNALFANPAMVNHIEENRVKEINLIFTSYKKLNSFNQAKLNKERLDAFYKIKPKLFSNKILWNIVSVTQSVESTAKEAVNGFIIYYNKKPIPKVNRAVEQKPVQKIPIAPPVKAKAKLKKLEVLIIDYEGRKFKKPPEFKEEKGSETFTLMLLDSIDLTNLERLGLIKLNTKYSYEFYVQENGTLTDAAVLSGIDNERDERILNILRGLPKWKKGRTKGKALKFKFDLMIEER